MSQTLLVTGASGQLGRSVVEHLLTTFQVAPERIIATTRHPEKLEELSQRGVQVRQADFDDPASLPVAFKGADRLLIVSTDSLDRPGHRSVQHAAAVQAAKSAGVAHLYYTSMPQPDDSAITFAHEHLDSEKALKDSGLEWTILRNGWYQENLFMSLPHAIASGQWFTSAGDGELAHVSREDCARAAAAALVSDDTAGKTYTLTGPTLLSTADIAALAREVFDQPIQVVQLNDEQLQGGMVQAGVPEALAPVFVSFDTNTREGKIEIRTDDVEKLTGQAPKSMKAFLTDNKEAFLNAAKG